MPLLASSLLAFFKTKWGVVLAVIVLGIGGYVVFFSNGKTQYQFITVSRGPITETVSVTGNTTPSDSVSLGFGVSGTIAGVYAKVGSHVAAGSVLARLDTADLAAQLAQARATVDTQKAKLAGLQAGARPEDIAASQAAYDKSAQDLLNLYAAVSDTEADAYAKAYDAVYTELSGFFSNADSPSPHLTFITANSQAQADAESLRVAVGTALAAWQKDLLTLHSADSATLDTAMTKALGYLSSARDLLNAAGTVVSSASNLSASTQATYQASVAAGLAEVNAAIKNLNSASQGISSQALYVTQLKAQLELKKAGSTAEDVAAQQAQVENAEAAVVSIEAKLGNASVVAPISGVVTQFDAKVGEVATAGTPLVSIISAGAFEVDADVPEIDIGKVAVGNPVSMTLDAFAGETFTGTVFYIDPAETVKQGVVNYKVKISFDTTDSRMKSGLTANVDIETKQRDAVLMLPQYAIIQNDQGAFVRILQNGVATDTPVTLGIQDADGNVEIVSGVTEGEQVLNIGLKQ